MAYKRKPSYYFATEAETGINTISIGSLIIVENYSGTGAKTFRKLNNTGVIDTTTIAQAITAKNIGKSDSIVALAMTTNQIDLAKSEYFSKTITVATTFTFINAAPTGTEDGFTLELTNGGAFAITFPTGIKWPSRLIPTFTTSGVDLVTFITRDGGVTWRASISKDNG